MFQTRTDCETGREQLRRLKSGWLRTASFAVAGLVCLQLGACKKINDVTASIGDMTSSIGNPGDALPRDEAGIRRYTEEWGKRYDKRPDDKRIAENFAKGLRALRRFDQAIAVLQRAAIKHPNDLNLLATYGKALADGGRFQEAAQILSNAFRPERPDWTILNTQGSIADQLGQQPLARQYYQDALKIAPHEPSILSNLGLSYALSRQLPEAENVLRQAASHPKANRRVRQNLALVLGLQGKFGEAEQALLQVLPPADARASIASIRSMIAQSNTWREIQQLDGPAAKKTRNGRTARPQAIAPGNG